VSTTTRSPRPTALRASDIADLTTASGFPCISVLLPTRPATRMTDVDRARLGELVQRVREELRRRGVTSPDRLLRRLELEVQHAARGATDRGLAVYVSLAVSRTFRLPQAVDEAVVVERTFATRALVAALHRLPPHALLVLHPTCSHLYAAADGQLRPVAQVDPFPTGGEVRVPRSDDDGHGTREEHVGQYLRAVDRMLGDYRSQHPSPLVLAGHPTLLDRFCHLSRHTERLAGRVPTSESGSVVDLALGAAEVLQAYLRRRGDDSLALLAAAVDERPEDVCSGITDCWRALPGRQPGLLLVEEDYVCPGRLTVRSPEPDGVPVAEELHDLVDDLIEQVIVRGGQLALVGDGDLRTHDRIALVLRPRRRSAPGQG
jgi:hypothetical protein